MAEEKKSIEIAPLQQIVALREAGIVRRAHTVPYIGEYNIAIHCYNALNLLLILYPGTPSIALVKTVMWHDVPERWTGDVPAPAKWLSPTLRNTLLSLEARVMRKLGLIYAFEDLTPEEDKWLKGVDLLELYCWAVEQETSGNICGAMSDMLRKIDRVFEEHRSLFPAEIINFWKIYHPKRLPEIDDLLC